MSSRKSIRVHLVSDSTGETLSFVCKAVMSKFDSISTTTHLWPLTSTESSLKELSGSLLAGDVVMHTIANHKLADILVELCDSVGALCIGVIDSIAESVGGYISEVPSQGVGKQHIFDEDYIKRISAISFSIDHDDGQGGADIRDADIIILGPSRTSKTPTSMYLAHKGYKTANIPLVYGKGFDVSRVQNAFIVGFAADPLVLSEIRKNREKGISHGLSLKIDYSNLESVSDDLSKAISFYRKNQITTIDVTHRSIEEVSAMIIKLHRLWCIKTAPEVPHANF